MYQWTPKGEQFIEPDDSPQPYHGPRCPSCGRFIPITTFHTVHHAGSVAYVNRVIDNVFDDPFEFTEEVVMPPMDEIVARCSRCGKISIDSYPPYITNQSK